jgi:ATPase subunit of ABC transporter with duplicated ATPase domains
VEGATLANCEFSLAYGGKILLNGARLVLKRGRRYGLCGANGEGQDWALATAWAGRMRACLGSVRAVLGGAVGLVSLKPDSCFPTGPLAAQRPPADEHAPPAPSPAGVGKSTLMRAIAANKVDGFPPPDQVRTVYVEHDIQVSKG